jgi:hypothetical protein
VSTALELAKADMRGHLSGWFADLGFPFGGSTEMTGMRRLVLVTIPLAIGVLAVAACGETTYSLLPATSAFPVHTASFLPSAQTPTPSPSPSATAPLSPLDSLNAYVTSESARETQAGKLDPSQDTFGDANVAERSAPVAYGGGYVAVAAFGFDPNGQPVQVLSYAGGSWTVVATLGYPVEPSTVVHPDSLDLFGSTDDTADISVGYATGSAPDFLIPFTGSGCARGPVVSNASGTWQYLPFFYPGQTTANEVLGGNPRFDGGTLVSDNNCATSVPQNQRVTSTWTYDPSSGDLTASEQPGWPPSP